MALVESTSYPHHSAIHGSRDSSWLESSPPQSDACLNKGNCRPSSTQLEPTPNLDGLSIEGIGAFSTLSSLDALRSASNEGLAGPDTVHPQVSLDHIDRRDQEYDRPNIGTQDMRLHSRGPFSKWMRSLHRRATYRPSILGRHGSLLTHRLDANNNDDAAISQSLHRRASSSESSLRFVTAVRSASVSLASVSSAARSRRNTVRSKCFSRADRSSRASMSAARMSEDSFMAERSTKLDSATIERSLHRRRILEELITTEEGYIGDIRFLINVYVTILASAPSQAVGLRASINRNLTDIVELHEEILGELHRVVPDSEYTQLDTQPLSMLVCSQNIGKLHAHRRWRSLDAVPEHQGGQWLHEVPGMLADPQIAAEVARIFGKRMNRFFVYKEYGAKYDMMLKEVGAAPDTMPEWESYQKGLEALASTIGSDRNHPSTLKKSLTIGDLLMKPIQRICKYPLLFAELLKYTTVMDCPNSHMEVDSTLTRLREATAEINRATDDARVRGTLEKTWLLQDRLVFPQQKLDAAMRSRVRSFGRIHLCGVLHVLWQAKEKVQGQYMVCLLYHDVLCIASAGKADPIYTIMACINIRGAHVEDVDNGRGMQCHTAPFSWKLVFECDCELYEVVMTACSAKEEEEWRSRLARSGSENQRSENANIFSTVDLNMKSLGTVFGKQGTMARRLSIHRATTVTPKSPMCQVVLKNTSAMRDTPNTSSASLTINRSQSLLTTNARLPVLAPARDERARLETLLEDVWSKDVLPFPGLSGRSRGDHLVRASSVMRKFSMASLTDSFNKRSGSLSRRTRATEEATIEETNIALDLLGPERSSHSANSPVEDTLAETPGMGKESSAQASIYTKMESITKVDPADTEVTIRAAKTQIKSGELLAVNVSKEDADKTPRLRKTSPNSVRPVQSILADNTAAVREKKENAYKLSEEKNAGRWVKTSLSRNDGRGHGFRSLFR